MFKLWLPIFIFNSSYVLGFIVFTLPSHLLKYDCMFSLPSLFYFDPTQNATEWIPFDDVACKMFLFLTSFQSNWF